MKTYRTIDLLKAVHDEKIFKNKFRNIETETIINQGIKDSVVDQSKTFFNGCGFNFAPTNINIPRKLEEWLNEEWEEVQEPVSFIEAVKSGKKIRVECSNVNIDYDTLDNILIRLGKDYLKRDIVKILTNGKWYIKENEEETTFTDKTKFIKINYKDLRDQERRTKFFATQEEYEKWHEENWNDVVING